MKKILFTFLPVLFIAVACGNNRRPGLSDKELFAQRTVDSLQELEQKPDFSDMKTYVVPPGIKYKESRAVDPTNPPVVIDIANRSLNIKKFNLSDYYSKVRYVKLKHPQSASGGNFIIELKGGRIGLNEKIRSEYATPYSQFNFTNDFIIAGDICFGLHYYDKEGRLIHSIESNLFPKTYDASKEFISLEFSDLKGFYGKATVNENNCLYCVYEDNKNMLCLYDLTQQKRIMTRPMDGGALILDHQSMADYVYEPVRSPEDFLLTFDLKGDTLCRFPNYNPIPAVTGNTYNAPPSPDIYYYAKQLTVRQSLNDTVYRVISPKQIVPVYVLNFGTYGADVPTFFRGNLSEKLIPFAWKESQQYALLIYTQNRDSKNNRSNGSVRFFYSYFDKKSRQFYHFSEGSSIPPDLFFMENPIPDALPFMLSYVEIEDNQLRVFYSKKRLEEISKNSLSPEQQNKLKTMQNELDDSEVLIMILE